MELSLMAVGFVFWLKTLKFFANYFSSIGVEAQFIEPVKGKDN
jgi:hypothetical protein